MRLYLASCVTLMLLCSTSEAHRHHHHSPSPHVDDPIVARHVITTVEHLPSPAAIVAKRFPHLYGVQYVDVVFMTTFPPYAGKWRE